MRGQTHHSWLADSWHAGCLPVMAILITLLIAWIRG